jgi:hypothetical protein
VKNDVLIVGLDGVHQYVRTLWRTEAFRRSHQAGGFVWTLVDAFGALPRLFADLSSHGGGEGRLSGWWGVVYRPEQVGDLEHDLALLREISLGARMFYLPGTTAAAWRAKLSALEVAAEVEAGFASFLEIPGLLEHASDSAGYWSCFLNDAALVQAWNDSAASTTNVLAEHCRIALSKGYGLTPTGLQLGSESFSSWAARWEHRYAEVESRMAAISAVAGSGDRQTAAHLLARWVEANTGEAAPRGAPQAGGTEALIVPAREEVARRIQFATRELVARLAIAGRSTALDFFVENPGGSGAAFSVRVGEDGSLSIRVFRLNPKADGLAGFPAGMSDPVGSTAPFAQVDIRSLAELARRLEERLRELMQSRPPYGHA